ncbi:MAG: hypothetical protein K2X81_07805 [Candidatus Obscuribacterales bacterium]|nr:hypothetical protein [Candidatus Obscuribacterales bacterium]
MPILDGGKIAFLVYSLITNSPPAEDAETLILVVSFMILMVIFFAALYRNFKYPFPK